MQNSHTETFRTGAAAFLGMTAGAAVILSLPFAEKNFIFLVGVPFLFLVLVLAVVRIEAVVLLLLFSRALLDPFLEGTRIIGGGFGLGALINLFVIALTGILFLRTLQWPAVDGLQKSWFFYLLFNAAAVVLSPVPVPAVKLFFNLVTYACMALLPFFLIRSASGVRFWLKALLGSSLLPVLAAHADWARGGIYFEDAGQRILGSFTHPNILAFYLVLVLAQVFLILKTPSFQLSRLQRNLLWLYLADLILLLVATKSRNAWIACWLFFLVYGLLKDRRLLLACIAVPPFLLLLPDVRDRIKDLCYGTGSDSASRLNSFAWRLKLWKAGFEAALRENFLFGHGLGSFKILSTRFFISDAGVGAHNVYLEILFETGLAGFTAFLAIFASSGAKLFAAFKKTALGPWSAVYAAALAYLASYLFACAGDNMLYYLSFNWYCWFFLGVMLCAVRVSHDESLRHHSVV